MSHLAVKIRRVAPGDEPAIARLWQGLADYHARIDPRFAPATQGAAARYAERMIERRKNPLTRAFVAEVDGQVVGYVLGAVIELHPDLFEHANTGFIADIAVDENHRREGIARGLLDELLGWFRGHNIAYVELQVATANAPGRAFWAAVGGEDLMVRMRLYLDTIPLSKGDEGDRPAVSDR